MAEIFRKLKSLDFQWKLITDYLIRCRSVCVGVRAEGRGKGREGRGGRYVELLAVRRKLLLLAFELWLFGCRYSQPTSGVEVKVDLQLYQIDHKNYLLDFKCVSPSEAELSAPSNTERHYTMEFFEMCARIISSLAQ